MNKLPAHQGTIQPNAQTLIPCPAHSHRAPAGCSLAFGVLGSPHQRPSPHVASRSMTRNPTGARSARARCPREHDAMPCTARLRPCQLGRHPASSSPPSPRSAATGDMLLLDSSVVPTGQSAAAADPSRPPSCLFFSSLASICCYR
jgi:hypothetical protein